VSGAPAGAWPVRSRESLLVAIGVLAVTLAMTAPALVLIPGRDSGVYLYVGQGILAGEVPYRDAWDHKPPLIHFIYALGLLLTGGRTWGPWLRELLAVSAAGWLSVRLFQPLHGRGVALAVTAIWMLNLCALMERGGYTELFTLPLQMGALVLLVRWRTEPERLRWPLGLGLLAGAAFLLRQNHLARFVAVFIAGALPGRGRQQLARSLRGAGAVAAGGLVAVAPFALYFLVQRAWGAMWDAAFVYNLLYTDVAPAERLRAIGFGLERIPWSYGALAVWLWSLGRLARRRPPAAGPGGALATAALVAVPLEFYLSAASAKHFGHYFILCLPALAVLLAELCGFAARRGDAPGRTARWWRAALVVLVLAALASLRFDDLRARYRAMTDPATDLPYRQCAAFLRASTTPAETALVWGSDPVILVLAGRRSPTRFVGQYPLMTRGYHLAEVTAEFVDDLARNPPAVIVDSGHGWFPSLAPGRHAPVTLPDRSEARVYQPLLPMMAAFFAQVDRDYVRVASFGPADVYVRSAGRSSRNRGRSPAGVAASSPRAISASVRPSTGCTRRGARSASGRAAWRWRRRSGAGTVEPSTSRTSSFHSARSTSIVRGANLSRGSRTRPSARSTPPQTSRLTASAVSAVCSRTAALRNEPGCAVPTARVS